MTRTCGVFLIALLVGCVPKREYTALELRLDRAEGELAHLQAQQVERTNEVVSLEEALVGERNRFEELHTTYSQLQEEHLAVQRQLAELERAQADLQARNAELLTKLQQRAHLQAEVEEMQRALQELDRRKAQAERRVEAFRDMLARFQALIDAGTLQVQLVDGRMVVALATDVLFDSGSARLSAAGRESVVEVAGVLASIPDRRFQVEGHTDSVPISTAQYPSNWELASARALTVVRAMLDAGLPPERVSAASYGPFAPVDTNRTPEGRSANRRIAIVVVPDLSDLPGAEELQGLGP